MRASWWNVSWVVSFDTPGLACSQTACSLLAHVYVRCIIDLRLPPSLTLDASKVFHKKNRGVIQLNRQNYWSGLFAGGIMGVILGMFFASRHRPQQKLLMQSGEIGNRARKVMRGISRGMGDMLRR